MNVILDGYTVEAEICSLNEAKLVGNALESILGQTFILDNPRKVSITLVDSSSTDGTQDIARTYNVNVLNTPLGKLTGRDYAIRRSSADIIVALDADTTYPPDFMSKLLHHFADPNVVAVSGLQRTGNPIGEMWRGVTYLSAISGISKWMMGGASAFKRQAYLDIGGFDLTINQKDIKTVWWEEEMQFGWKLAQIGRYVFDPEAVAKSSSRRWDLNPEFWNRVGKDTF